MRTDVEFEAEGVTLRELFYRPDGSSDAVPTVVMAHGFSAVKEMYLDAYADRFTNAGLAALVFDNRNFGASDGEPRQEIDPWAQVRDDRHAITFARTLSDVRRDAIGVWGSSYSGGHVIVVAAIDRRVRAAVAQVPLISGWRNVLRLVRADLVAQFRGMFDADRDARYEGKDPAMVPVVNDDPLGPAVLLDARLVRVVHRDGADVCPGMAQRGDAPLGRAADRVRARQLHRPGQPDAVADARRGNRSPHCR